MLNTLCVSQNLGRMERKRKGGGGKGERGGRRKGRRGGEGREKVAEANVGKEGGQNSVSQKKEDVQNGWIGKNDGDKFRRVRKKQTGEGADGELKSIIIQCHHTIVHRSVAILCKGLHLPLVAPNTSAC